jgi:hypothetical protein
MEATMSAARRQYGRTTAILRECVKTARDSNGPVVFLCSGDGTMPRYAWNLLTDVVLTGIPVASVSPSRREVRFAGGGSVVIRTMESDLRGLDHVSVRTDHYWPKEEKRGRVR